MSKCPHVKVTPWKHSYGVEARFEVGDNWLTIKQRKDGHFRVMGIIVDRENDRRKGLGTCLYEAAAKYVCSQGKQLFSDQLRSVESNGFWQKQASRGRATCIKCHDYKSNPHYRILDSICRSGCREYSLKPCETALGHAKRRR